MHGCALPGRPPPPARRPAGPSLAAGLSVLIAWALLLEVYFFPGLWKLRGEGLAWITGDGLRNLLHWKWFQQGEVPWLRVDHHPWLLQLGAASVVAFELGGPLLRLAPRLRWIWIVAALVFHASAEWLLGIRFSTLWLCFVVLVPWRRIVRTAPLAESSRPIWPVALVGALLLTGAGYAGLLGHRHAWPFACYPTFHRAVGPEMPALTIEIERSAGVTTYLERDWGRGWEVMMARPDRQQRLEAHLRTLPIDTTGATRIRFVLGWHTVDPARHGEPPLRREVLHQLDGDLPLAQGH